MPSIAKSLTLIINQSCNWQSAHYYLVYLSSLIGLRKLSGSEEKWIETKCNVNGIIPPSQLRIYWQWNVRFNPRINNHSDFTFIFTDIFGSIFRLPLILVLSGEEAARKHEPLNGNKWETNHFFIFNEICSNRRFIFCFYFSQPCNGNPSAKWH